MYDRQLAECAYNAILSIFALNTSTEVDFLTSVVDHAVRDRVIVVQLILSRTVAPELSPHNSWDDRGRQALQKLYKKANTW